jgi:hypothetical protein
MQPQMIDILPYRNDLEPLCPVDLCKMIQIPAESHTYACNLDDCHLHWSRHNGYFYPESHERRPSVISFLKMGMKIEHGYFYLASVNANGKTWRCSVKDCPNLIIED